MKTSPYLMPVAAGLGAIGLGWVGVNSVYLAPKDELMSRIEAKRSSIAAMEGTLKNRPDVRSEAKAIGASLLGEDLDELSARFRDGLARVAEQKGLIKVTVEAGRPQDELNPLINTKGIAVTLKKDLRKYPDFGVVRGTVKGQGSLEEALGVVAALEAQTWVHRVEGFSIKPADKDRTRFEVRVEAATLYAPDLAKAAGAAGPEPTLALASEKAGELVRQVAAKNVFRKPSDAGAPSVPVVTLKPSPSPDSEPPRAIPFATYEDWKLTGVALGHAGAEAFFLNVRTGEKVTVQKGGAVLDAVFLDGTGETAVVEIAGKRFEVTNGQTLAARKPMG
ncbi:hypothetical protein PHYC_00196 [Phycisphaerales bacterium]|nr:hypothetical protein PHYC_00196 [Phycisphaerales bacterium]